MGEVGCLKDGNFQNLQVDGTALEGNLRYKRNIISGLAALRTFTAEESGSIIFLDDLNGAYTLPPAEAGLEYYFVCGGVMDGATIAAAGGASATDVFFGTIKVINSGTDNRICSDEVVVMATAVASPTNFKKLTLDGDADTSGGNSGDTLHVVAINDDAWSVGGVLTTTHAVPAALNIISTA
jgi:hypothetical protein